MSNKTLLRYYLLINGLYASGIGIWSGTIYLYMKTVHYSYGQINLFLVIFWITSFLTEIPMGMLADKYGQLKIGMMSCIIRSLGLLLVAIANLNIIYLITGAILTAFGQSMYSGSLDSWIVNQTEKSPIDLDKLFAHKSLIVATATMLSGYIGSQYLGNINLKYPLIIGALLLLLPIPVFIVLDHQLTDFKQPINLGSLKSIFRFKQQPIHLNKSLTVYFLMLLSVLFITTNPYNQWQLFFQKSKSHIDTGYILVAINLVSILGSYLRSRIKIQNRIRLFSNQLYFLTFFLILAVFFKSKFKTISIIFFLIHTLITSSNEVIQVSLLQTKITSNKNRTTITSFYNCLESLISIMIIGINGIVSDKFGIGIGWISFAIIGIFLFIILKFLNQKLTVN